MEHDPVPAMLRRLDPHNRRILEEYQRQQKLRNLPDTTIKTKLFKVYAFLQYFNGPCCTARPEDTEAFYLKRQTEVRPATAFGDIQELRTFYKWLLPKKAVITFHPKRPRTDIPPEKVLNSTNARTLLGVCENQRDVALVSIFWDSGARLDEILGADIGDVAFDQHGAIIHVNGKTGRRPVRLTNCVPDLQLWLNRFHPMKDDKSAPLFVTLRKRGTNSYTRMKPRTVENLFKRLGDLAGCHKKTNPHAFRHGRATSRAPNFTEPMMRQYFGWSKGSQMPSVYVHMSARDIDDKILAIDGIKKEETPAPDPMAVVPCPRCGRPNAPDAMFCGVCLMALNDMALKYLNKGRETIDDPDMLIEYGQYRKNAKSSRE